MVCTSQVSSSVLVVLMCKKMRREVEKAGSILGNAVCTSGRYPVGQCRT
jgi:hypothetical protein